MNLHPHLERHISAQDPIRPWVMLGPLSEDVSNLIPGLSLFEQPAGTSGGSFIALVTAEAISKLASRPSESEVVTFRDRSERWSLVGGPEKHYSWGSWFPTNHLVSAFVSTRIFPDQPGPHRWRLATRIASCALVVLNGEVVFSTGIRPALAQEGFDTAEIEFEARLQPGENVLTIGLFRIGRMARVGGRLELLGGAATVRVPLSSRVSPEIRSQIEAQVNGIHLVRDIVYPEHPVGLNLKDAPTGTIPFSVRLVASTGATLRQAAPTAAGELILCQGAELCDGAYRIECEWTDRAGTRLASSAHAIHKTTPTPTRIGYEQLEARKRLVLEQYASSQEPRPIWREIARYAIRTPISPETRVRFATGCAINDFDRSGFEEARQVAQAAEVVILVVGDKSGLKIDCTCDEARDSADLALTGVQQELVETIAALRKPTIVALVNGRPFAIPNIADHVAAIVEA